MASSLNLSLTNELREFINSRVGDTGLYATPSEYLRDLIRKDMGAQTTLSHIMDGLNDIKKGQFSDKSIMDIFEEDD
jgi:antitoxin ParD1/3/4